VLRKKIMRAVSDSGPAEPGSAKSQPVQNLFDLMALVCKPDVIAHFDETHKNGTIRYGDLKKQLAEDMETFVAPLRSRIQDMLNNKELVTKAAKRGAEKARESAAKTITEVRSMMGFRGF
jgi:tryptophanyl-tRNA synthetase